MQEDLERARAPLTEGTSDERLKAEVQELRELKLEMMREIGELGPKNEALRQEVEEQKGVIETKTAELEDVLGQCEILQSMAEELGELVQNTKNENSKLQQDLEQKATKLEQQESKIDKLTSDKIGKESTCADIPNWIDELEAALAP